MREDEVREEEPPDYPQYVREWRGGFWSIAVPLLILALVAGVLAAYFLWST